MPRYDTPEPISVTVEIDIGSVLIRASSRTDTVVEVAPSNSAEDDDVRAAQQTTVSFAGGNLLVKGPRKRSFFGRSGSVNVTIELPSGSDVHGTSPVANYTCEGRLGQCRLKISAGDIQVDEAQAVRLKTDLGNIRVERTAGDADIAGTGRVDIGEIAGAATIKNLNGETAIGEVAGNLRASSSNGGITVGVAHADVEAKSAYGAIRVNEVMRGRTVLKTAAGNLEVGIREPTAAWLDVHTSLGSVRSSLAPSDGPGQSADTVEVHARTSIGDIVIRRP